MCTHPCSQEGFSTVSYGLLKIFLFIVLRRSTFRKRNSSLPIQQKQSIAPKREQRMVSAFWIVCFQGYEELHLIQSLMFICNAPQIALLKMKKKLQPFPQLNISHCNLCQLLAQSQPCQSNLECLAVIQFIVAVCGPQIRFQKKKGQQSGDLLKIVENNPSHDWHLIFLLTLAPSQRCCQDCIRSQPTTLLPEVWSILSPTVAVFEHFLLSAQGSLVLLTFEKKLKTGLNYTFLLFLVHAYLLFVVFMPGGFHVISDKDMIKKS